MPFSELLSKYKYSKSVLCHEGCTCLSLLKHFSAITNENSIHEEIKSRSKSGNACSHSVHNLLLFSSLSVNIKIKIQRIIILPVVLYGCETWSLTMREECRLRVFKNRVLRRIFVPKRDKVTGEWRRLHNEELNAVYL
jgi:hypothetical protein